jgi:Ca2+-binding RTX toxin-like protein
MRKSAVLLASVALTVLLASGVALAATFRGTDGDDRIVGTKKADQIFGLGGKDDLEGRGGGDVIHAGPGNDTGSGDSGNDTIYLGPGNDGADPPPFCFPPPDIGCVARPPGDYAGGLGKDVMHGGGGDDEMTGDRLLDGGASDPEGGADIMYGEDGRDEMDGSAGSNTLYGGGGGDLLVTNNFDHSEVWYGGAGDDKLLRWHDEVSGSWDVVAESDTFYGGTGDDLLYIEGYTEGNLFYAGAGNDRLKVGHVRGSGKNRICCGSGYDTVWYEGSRQDNVTHDCEKVRRG